MRMSSTVGCAFLALGLPLGALGCTVEAGEEPVGTTGEAVVRYPSGIPNGIQYGFQWTFGDYGTAHYLFPGLPSANLVACALNTVGGTFVNANDKIRVTREASGWSGYGSSGGGNPALDAMCFYLNGSTLGDEQVWDGTGTVTMMIGSNVAGANDTCFLTGLQGRFADGSTNNVVRLQIVNGQWKFDGVGTGKKAWARCVNIPTVGTEGSWVAGLTTPPAIIMPPNMLTTEGSNGPRFCGLTRIHGQIQNGWTGTYVQQLPPYDPVSYYYYLGGARNPGFFFGNSIGSTSRCIQ